VGFLQLSFPWLKPHLRHRRQVGHSGIGQDSRLICAHVLWNYTSKVGLLARNRYSASLESLVVYIRSMWIQKARS